MRFDAARVLKLAKALQFSQAFKFREGANLAVRGGTINNEQLSCLSFLRPKDLGDGSILAQELPGGRPR